MKIRTFVTGSLLFASLLAALPLYATTSARFIAQPSVSLQMSEHRIRQEIVAEFYRWQGVKYKLGGTTRRGIDCSALMQKIFHAAFDGQMRTTLPRTTSGQIQRGVKVYRNDLRVGDLLFFRLSPQQKHVGVYIGDDKFIHASTSKGVIISTLENDFWSDRYKTARRVIA